MWHMNKLLLKRCTERFLIVPESYCLKIHRLQVFSATFKIAFDFNSPSTCNQLPAKCPRFKSPYLQLIRFFVMPVFFPCWAIARDNRTLHQWRL